MRRLGAKQIDEAAKNLIKLKNKIKKRKRRKNEKENSDYYYDYINNIYFNWLWSA